MVGMIIYLGVAAVAIIGFRKYKDHFSKSQTTIIYTLITLLIFIPLPIIDPQVASRLGAFLFIPVALLILIFDSVISIRVRKLILTLVGIISIGSVGLLVSKNAPVDLSEEGLNDLENMQAYISNPDKTVIVARHNLEFWVAWVLHVDVSQESKFDNTLIDSYDEIFILNRVLTLEQQSMKLPGGGNQRSHFEEPLIPVNAYLVYSSKNFRLYRYKKDGEY